MLRSYETNAVFSWEKKKFDPSKVISLVEQDTKGHLVLSNKTAKCLLEQDEYKNNFVKVSIIGPARSGKSTLLGAIAEGQTNYFNTSHSNHITHTRGTDIAKKLYKTQMGNKIMFEDCEGKGFNPVEGFDSKLTLEVLLTSEIVMFNILTYNRVEVLKQLEELAIKLSPFSKQQKLGHLYFVIYLYNLTEAANVEDQFKTVLGNFTDKNWSPQEIKEWENNAIIRNAFEDISFIFIPKVTPKVMENLKQSSNIPENYLTRVNKFKRKIYNHVDMAVEKKTERLFNGQTLVSTLQGFFDKLKRVAPEELTVKGSRFQGEEVASQKRLEEFTKCLEDATNNIKQRYDRIDPVHIFNSTNQDYMSHLKKESEPCVKKLNDFISQAFFGKIKQKVSEDMVSSSNTHYDEFDNFCTQRLSMGNIARLQEQGQKHIDAEVQKNKEIQAKLKELKQFREEQRIKEENLRKEQEREFEEQKRKEEEKRNR
eukprot:Pgem_evm1s19797